MEHVKSTYWVAHTTNKEEENKLEGRKEDTKKLRYDLIPVYPLERVAEVYTIGAQKYGDRNWELGIKWGRIFGALLRHAFAWWSGEQFDKEDGQHHLASVVWAALTLMEYEKTHPELDDRSILQKDVASSVQLEQFVAALIQQVRKLPRSKDDPTGRKSTT